MNREFHVRPAYGFNVEGGPAFGHGDHVNGGHPGMTLRDYFAGQALAGMMSQSHAGPKDWTKMGHGWGEDTVNSLNKHEKHVASAMSAFAYQIADAMLAAREVQP